MSSLIRLAGGDGGGGRGDASGSGVAQPQVGAAGGGTPAPPRQQVRARRGQATDPHSIAEQGVGRYGGIKVYALLGDDGAEYAKSNTWEALFHVDDPGPRVPIAKGKFLDVFNKIFLTIFQFLFLLYTQYSTIWTKLSPAGHSLFPWFSRMYTSSLFIFYSSYKDS